MGHGRVCWTRRYAIDRRQHSREVREICSPHRGAEASEMQFLSYFVDRLILSRREEVISCFVENKGGMSTS